MVCILCQNPNTWIDLSSNVNSKWRRLISKYGEIKVKDGKLCRKCYLQIQKLHNHDVKFESLRQNFQSLCLKSLPQNQPTRLRPIKPKPLTELPPVTQHTGQNTPGSPAAKRQKADHSYFRLPKTQKKSTIPPISSSPPVTTEQLPMSDYKTIKSSLETRCVNTIAETMMQSPPLREATLRSIIADANQTAKSLGKRKCPTSCLMPKKYSNMKEFTWQNVVSHHRKLFPTLTDMMLAVSLGTEHMEDQEKVDKVTPKIGLIMAILLQTRHQDLSLVQRVISTIMYNNLCDQKVYDRLNPLGVCLSYGGMLNVIEEISGHFNQELVELIKNNKRFRLIGDNVNWYEHVSEETMGNRSHMKHAFGSMAIVQTLTFDDVPSIQRQPFYLVSPDILILNHPEWQEIKQEYVQLMSNVLCANIPYFSNAHTPSLIKGPYSDQLTQPNKLIPLPMLFKNEQHYSEVVDILDFYEDTLAAAYKEAGTPLMSETKIQVGGDQLTRERFSGAKRLRINGEDEMRQLQHLSPISFELFHMMMNFLNVIFKKLYKEDMNGDKGSMIAEKVRINRTTVNPDIRKAYDADRDFFVSYVHTHIIEASLSHFGMDTVDGVPTQKVAPEDPDKKSEWLKKEIGCIIDESIAPTLPGILNRLHSESSEPTGHGSAFDDQVNNYASLVLELGMLFLSLQDLIHLPNRDRGLRLLKYLMLILRHNNTRSKYADEICRFLVHQYIILSNKDAHQMFYGLFVNTKGKIDTHIPADDAMEGLVGVCKKHIHHMYSNKTEHNIQTKTRALGGIKTIAEQFDLTTDTITRAKKHTLASSADDEALMLSDLRQVKPFAKIPGRQFLSGTTVHNSAISDISAKDMREWVQLKKYIHATAKGN